jgi:hypothetical protein
MGTHIVYPLDEKMGSPRREIVTRKRWRGAGRLFILYR